MQNSVTNPTWGDVDSDRLGYDGAGRMITKRYLAGGVDGETHAYSDPESVVGFTTSFDQSSNKLYERHLHAESRSHLYQPYSSGVPQGGYDSIDRLRQYQRGTLTSGGGPTNAGGGAIDTAISLPNAKTQQTYALDGLGNWKNTTFTPVAGALTTDRRDHNYLNQITATKEDSDPKVPFSYDGTTGASNGNLKNDDVRGYLYDALNRLVQVDKDPNGTPALIGTYTYDAIGRRIRKVVTNGGLSGTIPNDTVDFTYTGWRCVEERDGSNNPTKQYVWGIYIDELIQQKNLTALNNFSANDELYAFQDLLYRNTGLADDAGTVREAYDCDAYGNTLIFRNSGSPPSAITYTDSDTQVVFPTCDAIFTGQRYDAEATIYYYRARYYIPLWGRFNSRDPLYRSIDENLYGYVEGNAPARLDPNGLRALKFCFGFTRDVIDNKEISRQALSNFTDVLRAAMQSAVAYCCQQYKLGCKDTKLRTPQPVSHEMDVSSPIEGGKDDAWLIKDIRGAKGVMDNIIEALSKVRNSRDCVPVIITNGLLHSKGTVGWALGKGMVIRFDPVFKNLYGDEKAKKKPEDAPRWANVLPHEMGHCIKWRPGCDEESTEVHELNDAKNIMYDTISSEWSTLDPKTVQTPDECYCKQLQKFIEMKPE